MNAIRVRRLIPTLMGAVLVSGLALAQSVPAVSDSRIADIKPTAEHREVAVNLFRAFLIHLENYALRPRGAADPETRTFAAFMDRLPPAAKSSLVKGVQRFSAQDPTKLRQFYGSFYAPTPQARLESVPRLRTFLRERQALFLRPRPLLKPDPQSPSGGLRAPWPLVESGLGGVLLLEPQKTFSGPRTLRLELELRSITVLKQNDDDTPEDEVYLGVITLPGRGDLKRYPAGDSYWQIRKGQTKTLDLGLATFDRLKAGDAFSSFISVFEYDDGTWGEIWSAMIQVAQYAFEAYLQAEIGTVLTEVVMYFLDDAWDWVASWFENPDDYIGTVAVQYALEREPRFWPPGGLIPTAVTRYPEGADARYKFDLRWVLSRVSRAR